MRIIGSGDFFELSSYDIGDAELVTIDCENVLTDYGDPEIRNGAKDKLVALGQHAYLAIATNNKSTSFIDELEEQLLPLNIPVLSGIDYKNKKTSDEMFVAAARHYGVETNKCAHIDDQILSFYGALSAGYERSILVKPYGSNNHKGVKAGRILDVTTRKLLLANKRISTLIINGIDG